MQRGIARQSHPRGVNMISVRQDGITRKIPSVSVLEAHLTIRAIISEMPLMDDSELRVRLLVWNSTHGFSKEADNIGLHQIQVRTGLRKEDIEKAFKRIAERPGAVPIHRHVPELK